MSNVIDKIRLSGVTYTLSATSAGGSPTVELTQAEYDALVSAGTVSADTYYIISDAPAVDISNYWTSAQTQSAITQSVSGKASQSDLETVSGQVANKQDTLVSGTNIKTINNTSILGSGNIDIQGGGGGGKAVSGGTNISITTGETADTINCTLPISAGTGANSIIEGNDTTASGRYSHAEGRYTIASGVASHAEGYYTKANGTNSHAEGSSTSATSEDSHSEGHHTKASGVYGSHAEGRYTIASGVASHAEGYYTEAKNNAEHASGWYNVSSSASTTFGDSGNTLFSVGNGTAENARHNAFEIRQNGDIYISSGGTDIKLQDNLGGGGGSVTVDPSLNSGSTNAVANSAITTAFKNTDYVTTSFSSENLDLVKKDPFDTSYRTVVAFGKINGSAIASSYSSLRPSFSLVETSAITTSISSSSTDAQVPSAKAVYDALGSASGGITSGEVQTMINESISGKIDSESAVTLSTDQSITGEKTFVGEKRIKFQQTSNTSKPGFTLYTSGGTTGAYEVGSFEYRPNTISGSPLMYIGHFRDNLASENNIPQTYVGFRQFDYTNNAAYNYLVPQPADAKTPFSLKSSFKNFYAPIGFKVDSGTTVTSDNTGVVDLSSYIGGGGIDSGTVQTMIDSSISGKADTSSLATVATSGSYDDLTNKPTIPTSASQLTNDAGYLVANDISGKTDTTAFTAHTSDTTIHVTTAQTAAWNAKQNALTIDSTVTSGSTNPVQGGAVYTQLGGLKLQQITQSAYDALTTKDSSTLYIIVN